jgi:hypothetical protein
MAHCYVYLSQSTATSIGAGLGCHRPWHNYLSVWDLTLKKYMCYICLLPRKPIHWENKFEGDTTRKVSMADELNVEPWLLMHHPDDFCSLRGACQNFSFLVFEAI